MVVIFSLLASLVVKGVTGNTFCFSQVLANKGVTNCTLCISQLLAKKGVTGLRFGDNPFSNEPLRVWA